MPTEIGSRVAELRAGADARLAFVIAADGQLLAGDGEVHDVDTTTLAERVTAQMTGMDLKSKLLRERGHDFYDAEQGVNVHVALVSRRVILIVFYDSRSSTGLV